MRRSWTAMLLSLTLSTAFALDPYASILTTATTASDEYALGKEYTDSSVWYYGVWNDPKQQARVETITRRLVAASDRPDLIVNVTLLNDREVNAMAMPGGFLIVNRGLLEMLDDDELAFVLGHELSHVLLRHSASTNNLQNATQSVSQLDAARMSGDKVAVEQQMESIYLMMASHSRQLELEADLYGLLYSVRAGYPAKASVTALQDVEKSIGGDMTPEEVPWASHPLFADRISQLQAGNEGIQRTHALFQAGVAWLDAGRHEDAVGAFQQFLTLFPHSQAAWSNLGAAYLFQARKASPDTWVDRMPLHADSGVTLRGDASIVRERARDALSHALQLDPADPVALGLFGVLARMEKRLPEARQLLERALSLAPDTPALLVDLANVAASEGKDADALAGWNKALAKAPDAVEAKVNVARMYEKTGDKKAAITAWTALLDDKTWRAEATTRLEALGAKPKPPPPSTSAGQEVLTVKGVPATYGGELGGLIGALGAADETIDSVSDPERKYLYWSGPQVEVLVQGDRIRYVGVWDDPTIRTRCGAALGMTEAEALKACGPTSATYEVGGMSALIWANTGLSMTVADGVVTGIAVEQAR